MSKLLKDKFEEENKDQQNNELQLYLSIFPMIRFLKNNNQYYQYNQEMYTKDYNYIDNYNNMNKKIQKKIRRCSSMQKIEYNKNIISENNLLNTNSKELNKKMKKNPTMMSQ